MSLREPFPKLDDTNHELTSPKTIKYNCVAWAAQNTQRWWQPGVFWPIETSQDEHGVLPVASISVTETKAAPVAANSESASM